MVVSRPEQALIRAFYEDYPSLKRVSRELGYSPNTVKKYVQEDFVVTKQNLVKKLRSRDERLIGLYVGMWMGDGTQFRSEGGYIVKVCLDSRNSELIAFTQWMFSELFGCVSWALTEKGNNRGYVKVHSKFIYEFIRKYCFFDDNKTASVRLKNSVQEYSREFLEGCLLGLTLTDGYLRRTFRFNVTSVALANNMKDILLYFGWSAKTYIQKRDNPRWASLIHTTLLVKDSREVTCVLDECLEQLGYGKKFKVLKYGFI
ncbi:MAG: hypothetical protein ACMXYD_02675 [Candidatus Woesearchaeota archaeon]